MDAPPDKVFTVRIDLNGSIICDRYELRRVLREIANKVPVSPHESEYQKIEDKYGNEIGSWCIELLPKGE